MQSRYRWLIFLSCLCLLLNLAADTSNNSTADENTLVIGMLNFDYVLDPRKGHTSNDMQILNGLYEGLVAYHPITMETIPAQAYQWEISPDNTVYTFYLRDNAYYADGTPVTAEDFRQSFLRNLDPKAGSEYAGYLDVIKGAKNYREGKNSDPLSVAIRALAPKKLEITLEKPANHFLKVLCMIIFSPIHPAYYKLENWEQKVPLYTNGPFMLYQRDDKRLLFVKNKYYWDSSQVKLNGIAINFYEDPAAISHDFNVGKIHWTDLNSCLYEELDSFAKEKIVHNAMFATVFLFFNCQLKPFNDPRVRKGLALLLPWDALRSPQYFYYPTNRLVPSIPKYPPVKGIEKQDIKAALALLEEAGFPKGKGLPPITFLKTKSNNYFFDILAKAWQEYLEVKVVSKEVSYDFFFKEVNQRDYVITYYNWVGDFADPLAFLQMWTSDNNLNTAGYMNSLYDNLIEEALYLAGIERYQKLSQAESLLLQECVVLPIEHFAVFNVIDLDIIGGWYTNPLDHHPLKYLEIKKERINKWIVKNPLELMDLL